MKMGARHSLLPGKDGEVLLSNCKVKDVILLFLSGDMYAGLYRTSRLWRHTPPTPSRIGRQWMTDDVEAEGLDLGQDSWLVSEEGRMGR